MYNRQYTFIIFEKELTSKIGKSTHHLLSILWPTRIEVNMVIIWKVLIFSNGKMSTILKNKNWILCTQVKYIYYNDNVEKVLIMDQIRLVCIMYILVYHTINHLNYFTDHDLWPLKGYFPLRSYFEKQILKNWILYKNNIIIFKFNTSLNDISLWYLSFKKKYCTQIGTSFWSNQY